MQCMDGKRKLIIQNPGKSRMQGSDKRFGQKDSDKKIRTKRSDKKGSDKRFEQKIGTKRSGKKVRAKRIGHKCKCRTGGKKIETIIEEFGQVVTGMLMVNGSLSLVGIVLIKLLKVL